jgi:hypothetical protein
VLSLCATRRDIGFALSRQRGNTDTNDLNYKLEWSIEGAAEVLLEYASGAVENVDEMDQTYNFCVRYKW